MKKIRVVRPIPSLLSIHFSHDLTKKMLLECIHNSCPCHYIHFCLTLSCLGGHLWGFLSLAIHISTNNSAIDNDKQVVNVLAMHWSLWILIIGPLLVTILYHNTAGWYVRLSLALEAQAYFLPKFEIELQKRLIASHLSSCWLDYRHAKTWSQRSLFYLITANWIYGIIIDVTFCNLTLTNPVDTTVP